MKRHAKKSSARDPFNAYREFAANLTVLDDILYGTCWTSQATRSYTVDWPAFLGDADAPLSAFATGIEVGTRSSEVPLASLLVGYTANMFDFLRQVAAAPTPDEVAAQLGKMREAVMKLASLAQGGTGRRPIVAEPEWFTYLSEDLQQRKIEAHIRTQGPRTPALHTVLQHHIEAIYDRGYYELKDDVAGDEALRQAEERGRSIVGFFEALPVVIRDLQNAEADCLALNAFMGRSRKAGTPGEPARNWALIRLMWIFRDVIGGELTIYARRTRNRVELATPEPSSECMAFVVDAMSHIVPVKANEISALEKQLGVLRAFIPLTRLASPR